MAERNEWCVTAGTQRLPLKIASKGLRYVSVVVRARILWRKEILRSMSNHTVIVLLSKEFVPLYQTLLWLAFIGILVFFSQGSFPL
jgi:hypothetical protein